MDDDIKTNGWGINKITEIEDSFELLKIFQDFYSITGRLPLSNELLIRCFSRWKSKFKTTLRPI